MTVHTTVAQHSLKAKKTLQKSFQQEDEPQITFEQVNVMAKQTINIFQESSTLEQIKPALINHAHLFDQLYEWAQGINMDNEASRQQIKSANIAIKP